LVIGAEDPTDVVGAMVAQAVASRGDLLAPDAVATIGDHIWIRWAFLLPAKAGRRCPKGG
jgi:hypothetical protein